MEEVYNMYPYDASAQGSDLLVTCDTRRILTQVSWRKEAKRLLNAKEIVYDDIRHIFGVKTKGAVGHHLTGRRKTTVEQFFALAKHLGVSGQELWEAGEEESPPPGPASCAGLESLPSEDRHHVDAVIKRFMASQPWDGKVERRKKPCLVSL